MEKDKKMPKATKAQASSENKRSTQTPKSESTKPTTRSSATRSNEKMQDKNHKK